MSSPSSPLVASHSPAGDAATLSRSSSNSDPSSDDNAATAAAAAADVAASWEALKELGNAAFKSNEYDGAIAAYSAAIQANNTAAVLYSNRSAAYLKRGDAALAAADARAAVALDRHFVKAYVRLHTALCSLAQFAEARDALRAGAEALGSSSIGSSDDVRQLRALARSADMADTAMRNARALLAGGQHDDAARALAPAQREFADCALLTFLYAEALAARDAEAAHALLLPWSRQYSDDAYYRYVRAVVFYYRGSDGARNAQLLLRDVLSADPDNKQAATLLKKLRAVEQHREAGNAAFRAKRAADAVREYTAAVDVDASNTRMAATLRANRAAARMDLRDYKGALLDCDFALAHGGSSAKLYARRSRVQEQLGNYDDALRDLQQAAQLDGEGGAFAHELRSLKARARQARRKDYYKVLDLARGEADDAAIKRAYKRACLQWHPDKWAHASDEEKAHAEAQFKEVGEAFAVLSDARKRQLYDAGQIDSEADLQSGGGGGGGYGGFASSSAAAQQEHLAEVINMMFGGGGGGVQFMHSGFDMGGGGARRARRGMSQGFYNF